MCIILLTPCISKRNHNEISSPTLAACNIFKVFAPCLKKCYPIHRSGSENTEPAKAHYSPLSHLSCLWNQHPKQEESCYCSAGASWAELKQPPWWVGVPVLVSGACQSLLGALVPLLLCCYWPALIMHSAEMFVSLTRTSATSLGKNCPRCFSCAANYSICKHLLHIQVIPLAPHTVLFSLCNQVIFTLPTSGTPSYLQNSFDQASFRPHFHNHISTAIQFNGNIKQVLSAFTRNWSNTWSCNCWNSYCN